MPSNRRSATGGPGASASFEAEGPKREKKEGGRGGAGGSGQVRRNEVLRLAADLFAERGYNATTVRDIADEAGILSGSLYHHFDSKESMIDAILSGFVEQMLDRYEAVLGEGESPTRTFEGLVRVSLEAMGESRSAILIYQSEASFLTEQPRFYYLRDAQRRFERIWTSVLKDGIAAGEFRDSLDPKLVYRLIRDAVWGAPRWYQRGSGLKPERITEQYAAVLIHGVSNT